MTASWLNTAWMIKCLPEAWAFRCSTSRPAQTQERVLAEILHANRQTDFGRRHGFDRIRSPQDYQQRVPPSLYEDYVPAIERIGRGESRVLTEEHVTLLEPTSGTTGGEKLIPYTVGLRRQFQRSVAAWLADLFWHRPAVRRGRAYWSISPALGPERRTTPGGKGTGIPIGFDDDAAYLGGFEQLLLRRLLAVPAGVARSPDLRTFRYRTLFGLLRAEDLSLISIWNPTFLPALLAPLEAWQERLCFDLGQVDRRRAQTVQAILRQAAPMGEKTRLLWPGLALISCWTDAAAEQYLGELRELFPGVELQGKGLLATEGCVSFPLIGQSAPALALRSHFFEFAPCDDGETGEQRRLLLAHELERGGRYRVVLTTAGGLYRYQLRDVVEVAGYLRQCPLLRFLGKGDRCSDLVGEKLSEPFVRQALDVVFARFRLKPRFALLAPIRSRPAHYCLYLQGAEPELRQQLENEIQMRLEDNPHYRYAVALGQLGPVEVRFFDPRGESGWLVYQRFCTAHGQKAGAIKPTVLETRSGWPEFVRTLDDTETGRLFGSAVKVSQ